MVHLSSQMQKCNQVALCVLCSNVIVLFCVWCDQWQNRVSFSFSWASSLCIVACSSFLLIFSLHLFLFWKYWCLLFLCVLLFLFVFKFVECTPMHTTTFSHSIHTTFCYYIILMWFVFKCPACIVAFARVFLCFEQQKTKNKNKNKKTKNKKMHADFLFLLKCWIW